MACSSSDKKSVDGGGGLAANGGSDAGASTGGSATSGGSMSGGSMSGGSQTTGGTMDPGGEAGASGGPPAPATCTGLVPSPDAQTLYSPPSGATWTYAGSEASGSAAIIAVAVNRSIRLVELDANGGMEQLLDEAEYKKNWSLDPTEVRAARRGTELDALVTDNAQMTLLRKRGGTVEVSGLERTSYMDLHVLGVAAKSGLALYFKGDDTKALEETLSVVDMESLNPVTRTFKGPASLTVTSDASGAWLAAERLELDSDCSATGQMQNCSGGAAAVPIYNCTWHLDVWSTSSSDALQGPPLTTIDVPATISPNCDDSTPAGLATFPSTLGTGPGFGAHHALAIDPTDNTLAVAVQRAMGTGSPGVQFEKIASDGKRIFTGITAAVSAINASSWLAVRAGRIFLCGDYRCAVGDASGGHSFMFAASLDLLSARGIVLLPDGIGLIGNSTPSLQQLACQH